MIDIENLCQGFGSHRRWRQVLHDVSLAVPEGACYGLIGESGSGKSTVLRCVARLNKGWTGIIRVDGRNAEEVPRLTWYTDIQMVFQDPYGSLHPKKTIGAILSEPLVIRKQPDVEKRVTRILDQVGLPSRYRYRYPNQLSGGQRQRVAIARAMVVEPRVLLLDEPTSALDVSVQAEILNLFDDLREELGLTYLLVSHDLAVIEHMCEEFAVMRGGRIVEKMSRDDLAKGLAREEYSRGLIAASEGYDRQLAYAQGATEA